jgi:hypothetical protein
MAHMSLAMRVEKLWEGTKEKRHYFPKLLARQRPTIPFEIHFTA